MKVPFKLLDELSKEMRYIKWNNHDICVTIFADVPKSWHDVGSVRMTWVPAAILPWNYRRKRKK